MLVWRDVPVMLNGNVIEMPGHSLFVTEACSGLRSLTALISLGVLMGGLWLEKPTTRVLLLLVTIPVAMVVNGWRVFLTGFLVAFVDPAMGEGFMHMTEGWVLFVVAFGILGGVTWILAKAEVRVRSWFSSEATRMAAPERTKLGRTRTGNPTLLANSTASSLVLRTDQAGWLRPIPSSMSEN